jgi:hypothetical protein
MGKAKVEGSVNGEAVRPKLHNQPNVRFRSAAMEKIAQLVGNIS